VGLQKYQKKKKKKKKVLKLKKNLIYKRKFW